MTRVTEIGALLLALIAGGCIEGQQATEFREESGTLALTHLGRRIRSEHPTERIAVARDAYCGFPEACPSAGGPSSWPPGVLDGARRELRANIVSGGPRHALKTSTVDLAVAFGPIRTVSKDSLELVVRYDHRGGARITRVSMRRTGAGWSVEAEKTLSTATYSDTLEIR